MEAGGDGTGNNRNGIAVGSGDRSDEGSSDCGDIGVVLEMMVVGRVVILVMEARRNRSNGRG